jgi:hypothetical protein
VSIFGSVRSYADTCSQSLSHATFLVVLHTLSGWGKTPCEPEPVGYPQQLAAGMPVTLCDSLCMYGRICLTHTHTHTHHIHTGTPCVFPKQWRRQEMCRAEWGNDEEKQGECFSGSYQRSMAIFCAHIESRINLVTMFTSTKSLCIYPHKCHSMYRQQRFPRATPSTRTT